MDAVATALKLGSGWSKPFSSGHCTTALTANRKQLVSVMLVHSPVKNTFETFGYKDKILIFFHKPGYECTRSHDFLIQGETELCF